jgi:hypothetical protein
MAKCLGALLLFLCGFLNNQSPAADMPAGKVVWWGRPAFPNDFRETNGIVEIDDEILSNVVSVASQMWQTLLLRNDGTVVAIGNNIYGGNDVPPGLSDVAKVFAEGNSCWAVKRDGTVVRWGNDDIETGDGVASLTNIVSITSAGYHSYLALKRDGTALGIRLDSPLDSRPAGIQPLIVNGRLLTNVAAFARMDQTPFVLESNGAVYCLGYQIPGQPVSQPRYELHGDVIYEYLGGESAQTPYSYASADPVMVDGQPVTNVMAFSAGLSRALFVKKDGTVVLWGANYNGSTPVPAGLTDVVAVATGGGHDLALKRDGTVAAWGNNSFGQTRVPIGLSNVVAIAAGDTISMALITGDIPSSVFVHPHGRLEELSQEADLVFKGQVESTIAVTNGLFPDWGKTHATVFKVISVLQGHVNTNEVTLWHRTGGPRIWRGGGRIPSSYNFEPGGCYLVFAVALEIPGQLYSPPSDAKSRPDEFRQTYRDGVTRTVDARVLNASSVKEAHWQELNLMLHDSNATNLLDAIDKLDHLSLAGRGDDQWDRTKDFKRPRVLAALLPLTTNSSEQIAVRALNCFSTDSNAVASLEPFAGTLIRVANQSHSSRARVEAISSLSGTHGDEVSASLLQLLKDKEEDVRVGAVRLVPRFPPPFAVSALRAQADDPSANVRSVVADVIGDGKMAGLLPTLAKLFQDPVGKDLPIKPLTMDQLKAGRRWSNIGDVHTSAGFAMVQFPPDQVSAILKTNLNDPGFHINFVTKLAQGDPEPWLPELVSILEARHAYIETYDKLPRDDPKRYEDLDGDKMLTGTYTKCWEDIRQYLLKQSPEKLAGAENQRYMDLLERMVRHNPNWREGSVEEARWLYELYWTKKLTDRGRELRKKFDSTDGWWFDDFEKGIRGEADPVNPPKI